MRTRLFVLLAALPLLAGACAGDSTPELTTTPTAAGPSLTITSPKGMSHVMGNIVSLQVDTTLPIMKADGDTSGKTGHFHVFVDKAPVKVVATAPPTLAAGQPLAIDVKVEGVQIVKADGDTSGKTGHLHAFVDVPPVTPGEVVPPGNLQIIHSATSPITITGLTPGEHTIWIVLGDGTHTAWKDSARDKVVVTVA